MCRRQAGLLHLLAHRLLWGRVRCLVVSGWQCGVAGCVRSRSFVIGSGRSRACGVLQFRCEGCWSSGGLLAEAFVAVWLAMCWYLALAAASCMAHAFHGPAGAAAGELPAC